jgi:hypothetical protein
MLSLLLLWLAVPFVSPQSLPAAVATAALLLLPTAASAADAVFP